MDAIDQFKFCPRCQASFQRKTDRLFVCQKCNLTFYQGVTLATTLILENSAGEILLVKRKFEPKKGFWDSPGGFVELHETAEEGARREAKEEVNVDLGELRYFGSYTDQYLYKEINYQTLGLVFVGQIGDQKVEVGDDAEDYQFFPKASVPLDQLAFASVRAGLEDYLKTGSWAGKIPYDQVPKPAL